MERVKVTVTIPDRSRFEDVVSAAKASGFEVEKAFPKLGVATGSIPPARLSALRAVAGLDSVEEERIYRPA